MTKETLKQALMAIIVGVAISLITQTAQALVSWLQSFDATAFGSTVGTATYFVQKLRNIV